MTAPLPHARTVAPRPVAHLALAAWLVVVSIGVPIAIRLLVPPQTAWIGWAMHLVPLVAWTAVLVPMIVRDRSPWLAVVDPARRPDARRTIYLLLDIAFTFGYLFAFSRLMPNRHDWAMTLMELLPLATWIVATGTLVGRPGSWWMVVAGAAVMLAWTIAAMVIVLYFASYLSGVYGGFGKASSLAALISVALLVELVALLPALQLKWAMTRRGRRAFGRAPIGRAHPEAAAPAPAVGAVA